MVLLVTKLSILPFNFAISFTNFDEITCLLTSDIKKTVSIFFTEMIRQKVFWQPYHHSYFCYRHTYDDIDYVLTCVENSLKKILVKNDV